MTSSRIPNAPATHQGAHGHPSIVPSADEIDATLDQLSSSCVLKLDGWWTYEFCYRKHLSQFHQPKESEKIDQLYYLGLHNPELPQGGIKNLKADRSLKFETMADLPYYSETYEDGTACDIPPYTHRKTEVRYYCHDQSTTIIGEVSEPSACTYIVNIHTKHMCNFLAFQPKNSPIRQVKCFIHENEL